MVKGNTKKRSKNKKKTKRQKKTIKNRNEARNYIELLNLSLKHLGSDISINEFTKDDYHLLTYLKTGIKKGFRVLKNRNIVKEIDCNSLCMTVSILNENIGPKKFDNLNSLEKMYLFFISYLVSDDNFPPLEATLSHALRNVNLKIKQHQLRYERYKKEKGETHKETRRSLKVIEGFQKKKELLINDGGRDPKNKYLFTLDPCSNIDCEYLHEYEMNKGEKFNKSYAKFCLNITEIFKGVVWLNMFSMFNQTSLSKIPITTVTKIYPMIDMRTFLSQKDILLIPTNSMCESLHAYGYGDYYNKLYDDYLSGEYWVYRGLNIEYKTIQQHSVKSLPRKHYIVALLEITCDYRLAENDKEKCGKQIIDDFMKFVKNIGPQPILNDISKGKRNLPHGGIRLDLKENIENSITSHWLYIHQSKLNDFISKNVIDN